MAWIRRLYRLALGLVAAGIVVVMTARTAQCDYGTAVITEPGDRFAALLPVAALPDLARSRDLDVVLELPSSRAVQVTWAQLRLADPNLVRRAGLAPSAQPSILLTGRLTAATAAWPGRAAREITPMEVIVGSEPVATLLADEFQVMLGTRGAGS
jgi:hypothetical protein